MQADPDRATVLVGEEMDDHCDHLQSVLEAAGVWVYRTSLTSLPTQPFSVVPGEGFRLGDCEITGRSLTGLWRRPGSPAVDGYSAGSVGFSDDECRDAFAGGLDAMGIEWLNSPAALLRAEHKIYQLTIARSLALSTPETLVTNIAPLAQDFSRRLGRVVVKPVRHGLVSTDPPRLAWAHEVSTDDLHDLDGPPVILQEFVPGTTHVRAVTIGDSLFAATLEADETDWRSTLSNHDNFVPASPDLARSLRPSALALSHALGLGYSAQDWKLTPDGRLVFLEANPNGQWRFLDPPFDDAVSATLARQLSLTGATS